MLRLATTASTAMRFVQPSLSQHTQALPSWLKRIVSDESEAPSLYAWTADNLHGHQQRRPPGVVTRHPGLSDPSRRIYVLGVGNLGRLYATSLASLGEAPVTLVLHRRSLLEHWVSDPAIEMTRGGLTERVSSFDMEWWTEERPSVGPVRQVCDGSKIQNLIIGTKAPDALPQVDRIRRYLDHTSTVAFVQNGMNKLWPPSGAIYNSRRFLPNDHPNWIICVTTHGVTSLGPFRSLHASPADVAMGPVLPNPGSQEGSEYLMGQILRAPYLSARRVQTATLWVLQLEKLVVNSTINPLTALLRCKNSLLFSRPGSHLEQVMDLLLVEASAVLRALVEDESSRKIIDDIERSTKEASPDDTRKALFDRFSYPQLRSMLHRVGEKVKDNKSSMFQDVTAGKPTEIREFNGWFIEMGEYLGIQTPNHKIICGLVEKGVILDESELGTFFPEVKAKS